MLHENAYLVPLFFFVTAWSAFAGFVLERIIYATVFCCVSSFVRASDGVDAVKRLASMELVKECISGYLDSAQGLVQSTATLISTLISSWLSILVMTGFVFIAASIHYEFAEVMTRFISVYNHDISKHARAAFLLTLQYSERFLQPLLYLWNYVWYIQKLFLVDVVLPLFLESAEYTGKLVTSCGLFTRSVSITLVSYVARLKQSDCSIDRLMNSEQLANGTIPCFVPGRRAIDLITPLGDFRLITMYTLLILKHACNALTPPLDLIAYPFLDINFAKGVHSVVNAFVYWFINMPLITVQRCAAVKTNYPEGHWMRHVSCTPDATPGFNYLITGVKRFGMLIDNWLNATWLVLLGAMGLPTPRCEQLPLMMRGFTESTLFGGNETRIVGLTSGAYAITDGLSVQYTFFLGQIRNVWSPFGWINGGVKIRHGIAAVSYDTAEDSIDASSGQATLSMLGCRCLDVDDPLGYDFKDGKMSRMVIECSILRYDPAVVNADEEIADVAAPHFVPVAFAVPAAPLYMRCATTKITVDSARFPLWRSGMHVEGGKGSSYDDDIDGEFTNADGVDGPDEIDAVLWVMPACDADKLAPACQSAMADAGCFPYCMAARRRGTRNDGLTLYSARDWANKVQLMEHDCSATLRPDTSANVVGFTADRALPADAEYKAVAYSNTGAPDGQFTFSASWDPRAQDCTYNAKSTSRVARGTPITKGSNVDRFSAVLMPQQPFVVAGETALTIVKIPDDDIEMGGSGYAIRVQRLFGQQGTGFVSLVEVNSELPANAPCITLDDCGKDSPSSKFKGKATVPYSVFSDASTHNPAVMTKWSVVYAANPSYEMFSQLFRYCAGEDTSLEYMLLSSFGPIRLWRVDAFAYDDPDGIRAVKTGSFVELEDGFQFSQEGDFCGHVFNVRVTSMEYLNDQNVAVQVLRASASNFNPNIRSFDDTVLTGPDGTPLLTYRTYFLNPETMQVRVDLMWSENNAASELGQGLLCPSQRRMPDFGSMTAEIAASALHVTRMFMELLLSGPAVFTPGAFARIQSMNLPINYGHTFLLSQGMGWLNFDPVFESLRRAHQHFFNSFTKLGSLFDDAPYINQFMNGFALYNQDYTPLVTANMRSYMGAAERAGGGVDGTITSMVQSVAGKQPIAFTGFVASAGMVNMAQYTMRMVRTLLVTMLLPGLDAAASGQHGERVVHGLWQVVYDSQENYKTLILASELRSCVGMQLMLGQSNPLGRLAGTVCESSVMFKLGAIETALAFFVDLPMLGCLCKDSEQKDWKRWAIDHCYTAAPTHFKGEILALIQGSESLTQLCDAGSLKVQSHIRTSMDPFLASSYRASATLGDTIDYMRFMWDKEAGSCRDYAGDASVTAILPDPIDFWRVCAWTKTCRAKCSGSILSFEAAKESYGVTIRDVRKVTSATTVQSSFFSDMDIIASRSMAPFDIIEMKEMHECFKTCGMTNTLLKDRCVAILGVEYGAVGVAADGSDNDAMTASIVVSEYCVPRRLDATVWLAKTWRIIDSHKWVGGMLQIKLLHQGGLHCHMFSSAFCSVAVVSTNAVSFYREDGMEYRLEEYSPISEDNTRLTNVHRIATLGSDVLIINGRGPTSGVDSVRVDMSLCVDTTPEWLYFTARPCMQNVIDNVLQDLPVCVLDRLGACESMLLIPTRDSAPVMKCGFDFDATNPGKADTMSLARSRGRLVSRGLCSQLPLSAGAVRQAGLYDMIKEPLMGTFSTTVQTRRSNVVVSSSISAIGLQLLAAFQEYNIFVANHPKKHVNWLAVMRIDSRAETFTYAGSEPVAMDVTMTHGCRIDDCTGCTMRSVHTLCQAAQQCTVAKCIGTTVNLNKPLCSMGKLLSDGVEQLLLQWRAGWNLISLMLIETIAVASTGAPAEEGVMAGADDMFTSQICLQKDTVFDMAGAITSFLNANANTVSNSMDTSGNVGGLFQQPKMFDVGAFVSSEYREAKRTMVLAAVTRFLGNVGLATVYPMIVARKMMICQATDIVSIFNVPDMTLTITSPEYEEAYDSMTGTCMSSFESDNANDKEASGVNAALDGIVAWLGAAPFANYKHVLDGALSYMMGLIRGVQDMVQVSDVQHCKLRDPSVTQQGQCACGDDPVRIPVLHAIESVETHAFWCTGILRMETPFGTPLFIFNPYTYDELLTAAEGTDKFLQCLGTEEHGSCADLKPVAPAMLKQQGANLLSVLTRCNANYQAMQWDAGAAQLYKDPELHPPYLEFLVDQIRELRATAIAASTSMDICMTTVLASGLSNDGCLLQHLASPAVGLRREDYFVYESLDTISAATPPVATHLIAACIVFSGPAKLNVAGANVSESFRRCTHPESAGAEPCRLEGYVWSSRSRNAVPVANMHAVIISDESAKAEMAGDTYQAISTDVLAAIEEARTRWSMDTIKVALFSAEGDFLHQAFDCVLMGPYGRADLSPRDLDDKLPALEYYRDRERGTTREFVLPCAGDELNGDTNPPFTCGSNVRRSIIKSFVRDGGGSDHEKDVDNSMKNAIKEQVHEMLDRAVGVFERPESLSCRCTVQGGQLKHSFSPGCCAASLGVLREGDATSLPGQLRKLSGSEKANVLAKLIPDDVREFNFSKIQNSGIGMDLLDKAFEYLQTDIWKNVTVSTSHDVDPAAYVLSDQQREIASRDGLYQTTTPLTTYGPADAFEQTTTSSAFEVCMGAVSQVMFTLPVGDPITGAPTTLSSMDAWDPTQTAPDGHFTALETWVHKLVADARHIAPLYWSHRLKHVASDSRVCAVLFSDHESPPPPPRGDGDDDDRFERLAAAVKPGSSMRGVYESLVLDAPDGDVVLQFPPPKDVDQDETIFHESNSSVWALGQVVRSCFCGWDSSRDDAGRVWCMIPPTVCSARKLAWSTSVARICTVQHGMYWNHWEKSEDSRAVGVEMQPLIQTFDRLECPWNMADAAAWGLLDEDAFVQHWLLRPEATTTTQARSEKARLTSKHLLHEGRGGVRYMNAGDVLKRGRDSPLMLFNPLEVASTIAQHHCEAHVNAAATASRESYADHFRDVLFPVVQGVPENRGTAFCMRYVVELATLVAMQHVLSDDDIGVVMQLEFVAEWRRKCHTQTKLLGFCALRNVFSAHRVSPSGGRSRSTSSGVLKNHAKCTSIEFTHEADLHTSESFVVAGASCVAVYHKAGVVRILDPCRVIHKCHASSSSTKTPFQVHVRAFIDKNVVGVAVLDPSSFLSHRSRTLSLKWSSPDDHHWQSAQKARDGFAEKHERDALDSQAVGLHIENLWQRYVRPEQTPQPAGSPTSQPQQPWHSASGPRTQDPSASCGGVSDWWPEAWEHPVGFHVTTPCKKPLGESSVVDPEPDSEPDSEPIVEYRTFSNQFEYNAAKHAMHYRHSELRDETLMMNHAGASGMCRLNTLAQTLREQNNMRVCTRMRKNAPVDYAVPLLFENSGTSIWTDKMCSTSALHVPWDPNTTVHARLRSSALLPSWPTDGETNWPSSNSPKLDLGLPADAHVDSWTQGGGTCGMPPLYECESDEHCSVHTVGLQKDVVFRCMNGVCMVTDTAEDAQTAEWATTDNYVQCTDHSHCKPAGINDNDITAQTLLCSGEGRCVLPVLEIVNDLEDSVDISWHAKSCDSASMDTVDMYGKSPWGRITGLFEAHGLCSYRNWYEYNSVYEAHCRGGKQSSEDQADKLCTLDENVKWTDTGQSQHAETSSIFDEREVLYQHAHRCDRNYQHYSNHVMCRPRTSTEPSNPLASLYKGSINISPARYSALYQTYYRESGGVEPAQHHVKIAQMEYMSNPTTGFLGGEEPSWGDLGLVPCIDIPQCSLPDYDIQGNVIAQRMVKKNDILIPYRVRDAVQCGSFGRIDDDDDTKCRVDFAVAPLAYLIAYKYDEVKLNCRLNSQINGWLKLFQDTVKKPYTGDTEGRDLIQDYLRTVINDVFKSDFTDMEGFESRMKCARFIAEHLADANNSAHGIPYDVVMEEEETQKQTHTTVWSNSVINHFTQHSMVEVAPMWWVKCHLLSGIKVSDTSTVECPAWTRSLPFTYDANEEVTLITFKEWLQQTARSLRNFDDLQLEAENRVREMGASVLSEMHAILNGMHPGVPLQPTCYTHRVFTAACKQQLAFQEMMFLTYNTASDNGINKYLTREPEDGCNCTDKDTCIPSIGNENPWPDDDENQESIMQGVESWLFGLSSTGWGDRVRKFENSELLRDAATVAQWGDPEIELFSQPWLQMGSAKGEKIPNDLATYMNDIFELVAKDQCYVLSHLEKAFTRGDGTKEECIYLGNAEKDPITMFEPAGDKSKDAIIQLSHGLYSRNTGDKDMDLKTEEMNVCGSFTDHTPVASFLRQRCFIEQKTTPLDETTDIFTCDGIDTLIGCTAKGDVIHNPNPGRVCYETGNTCFNQDKKKDFATSAMYNWKWATLPPGVRLITYAYSPNPDRIVGRNPIYNGEYEKLFWNNTFFDRHNVEERVKALDNVTPKKHVFPSPVAIDKEVIQKAVAEQKALENSNTKKISDEYKAAQAAVDIAAKAAVDDWNTPVDTCKGGWVAGVDAGKKHWQWDGKYVNKYTCKNVDGRQCCECQDSDIEVHRAWIITGHWGPDKVTFDDKSRNAWVVNGCMPCRYGTVPHATDRAVCVPWPTKARKVDLANAGPPPSCLMDRHQWPPLISWYHPGSMPKEKDHLRDDCPWCDDKPCRYHRSLPNYTGNTRYPPWFNCNLPRHPGASAGATGPANIVSKFDRLKKRIAGGLTDYPVKKASEISTSELHNIFARSYTDYTDTYFDYAEGPTYHAGQVYAGLTSGSSVVPLPSTYQALSLELMPGFSCGVTACDGHPLEVHDDYYYCAECSRTAPNRRYCTGTHGCRVVGMSKVPSANYTSYSPGWQKSRIYNLQNKIGIDHSLSVFDTAHLLVHLTMAQYRRRFLETASVKRDMSEPDAFSMRFRGSDILTNNTGPTSADAILQHPPAWTNFIKYSPSRALDWEARTGKKDGDVLKIDACLDTSIETTPVAYKQCSRDTQLIALRSRVNAAYNTSGPIVLPQGDHHLVLPVAASHLLSAGGGVLLAWERNEREQREKHIEYLLDFDKQCAATTIWDAVCRVDPDRTNAIELFNPWTGGSVSVPEGCDYRERDNSDQKKQLSDELDTTCLNAIECPMQNENSLFYLNQGPDCRLKHGEPRGVGQRMVRPSMRSNVCFLKPTVKGSTCKHMQGVLGGGADHGAAGSAHDNLYSYAVSPSADTREQGGLFVRPHRKLFRTPTFTASDVGIDKSFLHLSEKDIGGHQLHFVVSKEGVLRLYDTVLAGGFGSDGANAASRKEYLQVFKRKGNRDGEKLKRWLAWDVEMEHRDAIEHEPNIAEDGRGLHWACPLKQRYYLSGHAGENFRPSLPNQRRAAVIFERHNAEPGGSRKRSSTVQAPGATNTVLNALSMHTSNGFCFCNAQDSCQLPITSSEACGMTQSFDALRRNVWQTSSVQKGQSTAVCTEQLDWPYTGGTLRDGSEMQKQAKDAAGGTLRTSECNLLDRIHDFEYMYTKSTPAASSATRNTQVPGGDCFTGKAKRSTRGKAKRSTRDARSYSWSPAERRSCAGSCAAPPIFTAGSFDAQIPAETSFGVLYRQSAERAIAGNLRERLRSSLCGPAQDRTVSSTSTSCTALDRVLNVSSWVPAQFWPAFLDDVDTLFTIPAQNVSTTASAQSILEQSMLPPPLSAHTLLMQASQALEVNIADEEVTMWAVPWVFCTHPDPECTVKCDRDTLNNCHSRCAEIPNATCTQSIDRQTWLDPPSRVPACRAALLAASLDEDVQAVAPINVCDMDKVMNQLCVVLAAARNRIFDANCRASGLCHEERFFYVPGIYSAANQEFVKSTVENFYLAEDDRSCGVIEDDVFKSNQETVSQCASTQLQIVYELLRGLRVVVDTLMRIGYFASMVAINLLRFLFAAGTSSNSAAHILSQVEKYLELMITTMGKLWQALGDMVYNFIMDSGLGVVLQAFLDWICSVVTWIVENLWKEFLCSQVIKPLGDFMLTWEFFGQKPLKEFGEPLIEFHANNCLRDVQPCKPPIVPEEDPGPGSLPVATRCWSTYNTFLGDQQSLSCSAADTCMAGDISMLFGENTKSSSQTTGMAVCDSCPQPVSTSAARYGCDIVTKTCKCDVKSVMRTTCITNDECLFSGSSCDIVDNYFERDAFGSIECAQCTANRICLVSPGDSVGHCACATRDIAYATCAENARGDIVFTPAFSMCMVALGSAARSELQTSSLYRIEGKKLATARCDMLDASQRYCISVELGPNMAPTYAVGLDNLFSRRLLQIADTNSPASAFYRFIIPPSTYDLALQADWSTVRTSVCRFVPSLLRTEQATGASNSTPPAPLSISDAELLRSCVRWRAIGIEIVHMTNISSIVPDTFLIGPDDFADDIMGHPTRIYALLNRPWIWARAILHMQCMAPARVLIRDAYKWWTHANIEAFASANDFATIALAARAALRADNSSGNASTVDSSDARQLKDFSRSMSRHLTGSLASYIFGWAPNGRRNSGHSVGGNKHDKVFETTPDGPSVNATELFERAQLRQRRHELALGHAILHTPISRTHWVPEQETQQSHGDSPGGVASPGGDSDNAKVVAFETPSYSKHSSSTHVTPNNPTSRSLLQFVDDSFITRMNAVQQYSSEVALGDGVVQILPASAAEQFILGDMAWPPNYVYWSDSNSCNLATNMIASVHKATKLLSIAFDKDNVPERPTVSYNPLQLFVSTWQRGNDEENLRTQSKKREEEQRGFVQPAQSQTHNASSSFMTYIADEAPWYVAQPVLFVRQTTGLTETPFLGLALEIPSVLGKMLRCDIEAQMFCTEHHYSVFTSAIIAMIMLSIIGSISSIAGVPLVSTILSLIGFTSLVLFVSFGYAPSCMPLVPLCFFESMVADVVHWLPTHITIPNSILSCSHDQTVSVPPASCIVQCDTDPFYFRNWHANLGWTLCEQAPDACAYLLAYLRVPGNMYTTLVGAVSSTALEAAVYRSRLVLMSGDTNMVEGFQFCNTITAYSLIPLVSMLFFFVASVPLVVALAVRSIFSFVRTAFSAYIMTHT